MLSSVDWFLPTFREQEVRVEFYLSLYIVVKALLDDDHMAETCSDTK